MLTSYGNRAREIINEKGYGDNRMAHLSQSMYRQKTENIHNIIRDEKHFLRGNEYFNKTLESMLPDVVTREDIYRDKTNGRIVPLAQVYHHKELSEAYPDLFNEDHGIEVMFYNDPKGGVASYSSWAKTININIQRPERFWTSLRPEKYYSLVEIQSHLVHELTHAIQNEHGLATGSNPRDAMKDIPAVVGRVIGKWANVFHGKKVFLEEDGERVEMGSMADVITHLYWKNPSDEVTIKSTQNTNNKVGLYHQGIDKSGTTLKTLIEDGPGLLSGSPVQTIGFLATQKGNQDPFFKADEGEYGQYDFEGEHPYGERTLLDMVMNDLFDQAEFETETSYSIPYEGGRVIVEASPQLAKELQSSSWEDIAGGGRKRGLEPTTGVKDLNLFRKYKEKGYSDYMAFHRTMLDTYSSMMREEFPSEEHDLVFIGELHPQSIYRLSHGEIEARQQEFMQWSTPKMTKEMGEISTFIDAMKGADNTYDVSDMPAVVVNDRFHYSGPSALEGEVTARDSSDMNKVRFSVTEDPTGITSAREDVRFSVAPDWMNDIQSSVWEKMGGPHKGGSFKEKLEVLWTDIGTKIRQGMFDQYASIKDKLSDRAYILTRMSKSSDGALDAAFRLGRVSIDEDGAIDVDTEQESLVDVLKPLGDDLDVFLRWVAGHRAAELDSPWVSGERAMHFDPQTEQEIAVNRALRFLTPDEVNTLMTYNQGDTTNAVTGQDVSRAVLFDEVLKKFNEQNESIVEIAVKSGVVSQKEAETWKKFSYVPFYRVLNEDTQSGHGPKNLEGLVNQDAYKSLAGSDKPLNDLLQNVMMNWSHLLNASMKNNAATVVLEELSSDQMNSAINLGAYPTQDKELIDKLNQLDDKNIVGKLKSLMASPSREIMYTRVDGKKVYWMVEDPMILESLLSMHHVADAPGMKPFRAAKRWFTHAVTFSPEFKIRNLLRDSLTAVAVADTSFNVLGNVAKGWKGTQKNNKTYAHLIAGGGSMRFGYQYGNDPGMMKEMAKAGIKREFVLDNEDAKSNFDRAWKAMWAKTKGLYQSYEELGERLENVNRANIYDRLRAEGKSHLIASYEARDLMDFSSHGSWGAVQMVSQWSPFLNARLQGLYKLGRAGKLTKDNPQARQFWTAAMGYSLASVALYLAYMDDPDIKEREDWEKDTYHMFKLPGSDIIWRIPKAFELGVMATMFERSVQLMADDEFHGKHFVERMKHQITDTLAFDVRPQLIRPVFDIYSNKNPFTGREIETQAMKRLSPELRARPYSSELALAGSKVAGVLFPEGVTPSPVQIDYLVNGYFGYFAGMAMGSADLIINTLQGKERPDRNWDELPVIKAIVANKNLRNSRYGTLFYEQLKEANTAFADIKELRELGELEEAQELFKDKRLPLSYRKQFSKLQRKLSKVNKQIRRIANDPGMDGDLKRQRINRETEKKNALLRNIEKRYLKSLAA